MSSPRHEPLPDPPPREDGSCFICGQPRLREGVKALYARAAVSDPFCSSACARVWHGCELTGGKTGPVTSTW